MANAQEARRAAELRKIKGALKRVDEDAFGWCAECGEAIDARRLDIDLTAMQCAPCAGAAKR
ncbi:MAG: TraR/DksA family transcriptional regulator [Hyphococcus sp.]